MKITYPPELPITERRADLLAAIEANQVLIVAGETGSGKSTQLPKLCLELGRGKRGENNRGGWIGHTQPRRLAARSVAERVAEELETKLGEQVGYTVRFTDQVTKSTRVKLMTDGILLAEMQRDRKLSRYDTIIIDEAHERSLNIDFLLGYLKQLLPKRPDLKIIITSATIDTERFSQHFDEAPIIEVSGRSYPVTYRYRPLVDEAGEGIDQADGICDAVQELEKEGPGDILVFLSGERHIREAAEALEGLKLRDTEIFPLYARLSAAEQHKVFSPHKGRRIVLATNVAETSLTVPGIRYVVDPGNARISRYSHRTKVQRLPIEAVSQASANQRAGRCGRLGPGVCIRLYSEEDYLERPEFTEPEIQRTNLASVILQMASLNLGQVEDFPFVDPPDERSIRDGIALLEELDAVDPDLVGTRKWLTPLGRDLARFPLDPRMARMVIEADHNGCLNEVMVIVSGMSVIDPRERPRDKQQVAQDSHARFQHPDSDFLSYLNLWNHIHDLRKELSRNQFRRRCKKEFLNFNRVREWMDIHRQISNVAKEMRLRRNESEAEPDAIHQSLLTGLLSQIGMKDGKSGEFRGARNARFVIAPGSVFHKNSPNWVMAGELQETNRMYARVITRIRPEWAERAGEHLVKRSYGDPWWDAQRGTAMVEERVTLYGLPVIGKRRIGVKRVNPDTARELFVHHALIHGEWETHHDFDEHNRTVLEEIQAMGARARRDLTVDYDLLWNFYTERLPESVCSTSDFDKWWKQERRTNPELLNLRLDDLVEHDDQALDAEAFPTTWSAGPVPLPVSYAFEKDSENDGVTVTVPVEAFNTIDPASLEWNVPGLRTELVTELIRSLPKDLRRRFVPVPDTVRAVLPHLSPEAGPLVDQLREELRRHAGVLVPESDMLLENLPSHLVVTLAVVNAENQVLAQGNDYDDLAAELAGQVRDALQAGEHGGEAQQTLEKSGLTSWSFGDLPKQVETVAAGRPIAAFPSLVDREDSVAIQLLPSATEQFAAMWAGTRRMLRLTVGPPARLLNGLLNNQAQLALVSSSYDGKVAWIEDCTAAALDELLRDLGGPVWTEAEFETLRSQIKQRLPDVAGRVGKSAVKILMSTDALRRRLDTAGAPALGPAVRDISDHLDRLTYSGHISGVGAPKLDDVDRYIQAMAHRLDKLPDRVVQDRDQMGRVHRIEAQYDRVVESRPWGHELEDIAWHLEEFRVSCFAQHLGTRDRVSDKRIRKMLQEL